jgi:hypothetical protein
MYHEVLSRGEIMKAIVKGAIRNEKGQALILALILLAVGGLILAPLLAYMRTGLTAGEVCEVKTNELYAADAGVEDAVWKIQHQVDVPTGCYLDTTRSYNITDVNGKKVAYNITRANNVTLTYHVESIATGDGSGTKIDAYVGGTSKYGDYSGLLNYVLTSPGDFYCPTPPTPCLCSKLDNLVSPGCGAPNGPNSTYTDPWPTPDIASFYWEDVKNALPYYTSDILDAKNYAATGVGPLYWNRTGDLNVVNTGGNNLTLKLNGTLYIRDSTRAIFTPSQDMILDLNGQTIFVASNNTGGQYALSIGGKCSVKGPGVIIAVGDIYFAPQAQIGGQADPIFILSVSGTTLLQPGGDFYGAVAGGLEIDLKSKNKVFYPSGGFESYDLNFPNGTQWLTYSIVSWEVSPL